ARAGSILRRKSDSPRGSATADSNHYDDCRCASSGRRYRSLAAWRSERLRAAGPQGGEGLSLIRRAVAACYPQKLKLKAKREQRFAHEIRHKAVASARGFRHAPL